MCLFSISRARGWSIGTTCSTTSDCGVRPTTSLIESHDHNVAVINRTAGQGRYAQVEREQRWILPTRPDDLADPVSIVDLYIHGTRLRLRRMETIAVNPEVVYK